MNDAKNVKYQTISFSIRHRLHCVQCKLLWWLKSVEKTKKRNQFFLIRAEHDQIATDKMHLTCISSLGYITFDSDHVLIHWVFNLFIKRLASY